MDKSPFPGNGAPVSPLVKKKKKSSLFTFRNTSAWKKTSRQQLYLHICPVGLDSAIVMFAFQDLNAQNSPGKSNGMTEKMSLHQCVCVFALYLLTNTKWSSNQTGLVVWCVFFSVLLSVVGNLIETLWRKTDAMIALKRTIRCRHKHWLSDLAGLLSVQRILGCSRSCFYCGSVISSAPFSPSNRHINV